MADEVKPFGWMPCPDPRCNYAYRLWAHWRDGAPQPGVWAEVRTMRIHIRYAHGHDHEEDR